MTDLFDLYVIATIDGAMNNIPVYLITAESITNPADRWSSNQLYAEGVRSALGKTNMQSSMIERAIATDGRTGFGGHMPGSTLSFKAEDLIAMGLTSDVPPFS